MYIYIYIYVYIYMYIEILLNFSRVLDCYSYYTCEEKTLLYTTSSFMHLQSSGILHMF